MTQLCSNRKLWHKLSFYFLFSEHLSSVFLELVKIFDCNSTNSAWKCQAKHWSSFHKKHPIDTLFEKYSKCRIWIFEFWHFPPIFVLLKLACLVTLFDRQLQLFKNSPNWPFFWHFQLTFVHSKWKRSSLRLQCWMRLFYVIFKHSGYLSDLK